MSLTNPSFPWVEIAAKQFRQNHDSIGRVWSAWYHADIKYGRGTVALTSYTKIKTDMPPDELRKGLRDAWRTIRYYSPAIACAVGEFYRTYAVITDKEADEWVESTFQTHREGTVDDILYLHRNDLNPTLHFFPGQDGGEVVKTGHHFFNDGRGEFFFWDALLKLVASPKTVTFGDEDKHLPPARDDLLSLPSHPTIPSYIKGTAILGESFAADPVMLPLASGNGTHRFCRMRASLDESQTARLVSACKHHGVTVTGAIKAAHILTIREAAGAQESLRDQCSGLEFIDIRGAFPASHDSRSSFGTDYHVFLPGKFELGGGKTYIDVARDMTQWLRKTRQDLIESAEGLDAVAYMMLETLTKADPAPLPPIFSSIGILEDFMQHSHGDGKLVVEDTWMAVPAHHSPLNATWVWTWRGRLNLLMSFDEGYYDVDAVEAILKNTIDTTLRELGVEETAASHSAA